ncbi:MAG: glutathione S-transferase N-terminal domain-containing protein [Gammaproteobacteria bacterium]|nr:glutathione S-transferase N-terminal domain-containing protein [Gammaproteobacteria bacterium]
MAVVANRRSVMTLFSRLNCPHSHRARLVLAEKGITFEVVNVEGDELPEDLIDLNPYQSIPTLVDRDLVLYDTRVIMEYLDERFPHPPLMPVDPVTRARFRLALYRIERDWYSLVDVLQTSNDKTSIANARKELRDAILSTAEVFTLKPYFLSEEFSLVDCSIAPIFWRLRQYEIDLPGQAKAVRKYMDRVFSRPSFVNSLTEIEEELNVG